MRLRRCAVLYLEPRERVAFDLASLLSGGDGLKRERQWLALAPHLAAEVAVSEEAREVLGALSPSAWVEHSVVLARHPPAVVEELLQQGLLVGDAPEYADTHRRDEALRAAHWRPLNAAFHYLDRWERVNSEQAVEALGIGSFGEMVAKLGEPPPHFHTRCDGQPRIGLPAPAKTALDALLAGRATCRNWDSTRALDLATFSAVMQRVHGAQAVYDAAPGGSVVKKTSPSGGGLHPLGAYLLVRHVEGLAPGFYHYHAGEHALEPLPWPQALVEDGATPEASKVRDFASALLAGQQWFADAHVLVFLLARFRRHTWKYRNHAKAYRVMLLDAGHLSQTLYVTATELGLGAFITAAVNDSEIEEALGVDPLEEGLIAVNGFGWRGPERETVEFDPQRTVWGDWGKGGE
jgi:putative peptide maturation dehydrogenase